MASEYSSVFESLSESRLISDSLPELPKFVVSVTALDISQKILTKHKTIKTSLNLANFLITNTPLFYLKLLPKATI